MLFGTAALDGAQAEYVCPPVDPVIMLTDSTNIQVRIPLADGTAMKAPPEIDDKALVLMADIFPTGYFAAHNGFKDLTKEQIKDATVVLIGCGYGFRLRVSRQSEANEAADPSAYVP